MKIALILRGLSGSGKSTLAEQYQTVCRDAGHSCSVHSSDAFFINSAGVYQWEAAGVPAAHAWNQRQFEASLKGNINLVICDNTNIKKRDYHPYIVLANRYGYEVQIQALPHLDVRLAAWRNVHGCPEATIRWQLENWED